jgi:hypothetical protein
MKSIISSTNKSSTCRTGSSFFGVEFMHNFCCCISTTSLALDAFDILLSTSGVMALKAFFSHHMAIGDANILCKKNLFVGVDGTVDYVNDDNHENVAALNAADGIDAAAADTVDRTLDYVHDDDCEHCDGGRLIMAKTISRRLLWTFERRRRCCMMLLYLFEWRWWCFF